VRLPGYPAAFLLLLLSTLSAITGRAAEQIEHRGDTLFLSADVSNLKPFTGEELELTYTLFFHGIAPKILERGNPVHQGLWAEEVDARQHIPSTPAAVHNKVFRQAIIKRMKLVPLRSGTLSVSGYKLLCLFPKNLSSETENAPDDSLLLSAPDITLQVLPLPEPEPADFNGAVGTYTVSASVDADTVSSGSTVLLTTVISGNGSPRTLPDIPPSLPEGISILTTKGDDNIDNAADRRTRTYSLMAEKAGTYTFSPLLFTAFDPEKQEYTNLTSGELSLTVLPPIASNAEHKHAPGATTDEIASREPIHLSRLLIALLPALSGALLYLLIRKVLKSGGRSVDAPRRKQHRKNAHTLPELREDVLKTLRLRCGMDPESMTRRELMEKLEKQGTDDPLVKKLLALLDAFDRLDFAPGEPDGEALEKLRQEYKAAMEQPEQQ